jgi:hypothetical protein
MTHKFYWMDTYYVTRHIQKDGRINLGTALHIFPDCDTVRDRPMFTITGTVVNDICVCKKCEARLEKQRTESHVRSQHGTGSLLPDAKVVNDQIRQCSEIISEIYSDTNTRLNQLYEVRTDTVDKQGDAPELPKPSGGVPRNCPW